MQRLYLKKLLLSVLILAATTSGALYAAPGDLDSTFGGGKGWVSSGFEAAAIQISKCRGGISQAEDDQ